MLESKALSLKGSGVLLFDVPDTLGNAKTHLQHVLLATALNFVRLDAVPGFDQGLQVERTSSPPSRSTRPEVQKAER